MAAMQTALSSSYVLVLVVVISSVLANCVSTKALDLQREYLSIIPDLNSEGTRIGIIAVKSKEEKAFFDTDAFKPHPRFPSVDVAGRRYRVGTIHGKKILFVRCGVGMRNAATATQQMVDLFNLSGIIHFGISGNGDSSLSIGDIVIPKRFIQTGLWDWLNYGAPLKKYDIAKLDIGDYNIPLGDGINKLGRIGFKDHEYYSESGEPNVPKYIVWANTSTNWLSVANNLEGMDLDQCLDKSSCLPRKPQVVVGLKGSTSDIYVDNYAYREFLHKTFGVSSLDMESFAVVTTSMSNGCPVIVFRGLSNLAGVPSQMDSSNIFKPLAYNNVAKAVRQYIKVFPNKVFGNYKIEPFISM